MEEGKIVFEGKSKKEHRFFIRYPKNGDAEVMLSYINALSEEQTYVLLQGKKKTLEEEQKFLEDTLKKMREHSNFVLLAFINDMLIGISNVSMDREAASHVGYIGISITPKYRDEGIGTIFMRLVLEEAEKYISDLRIVTLGVFEDNTPAIVMYKKLGFQEFGRLPEGLSRRGKYSDHIMMYKKLK